MAWNQIVNIGLLLANIFITTYFVNTRSQNTSCRKEANFRAIGTGFAVKTKSSKLISTTNAISLSYCALKCINTNGCKSMLYNKTSTKQNCQLLNVEKRSLANDDIQNSIGWDYYEPLPQRSSQCLTDSSTGGSEHTESCSSSTDNCYAICEIGWELYEGYCYYFSNSTNSWLEARQSCHSLGADLAIIKTSNESAFVVSKMSSSYHWIGASDIAVEGTFKWVDGSSMYYKPWCDGEPNDQQSIENCLEARACGWNDAPCDTYKKYICKKMA